MYLLLRIKYLPALGVIGLSSAAWVEKNEPQLTKFKLSAMMKKFLFACVVLLTGLCMNAQSVSYTVDAVGTDYITITFTPDAEAAGYAICLFEAGTAEQQFAMFGPWMGFQTMGDMIRGWGITKTEAYQHTWTNQNPGTDYEIYVQCWDANNVDADMIIIPVTTASMGGDGLAEMTIEIGEFGGDEETGYYQWVTYIPNDQVALHRDIIIVKSAYESEEWGEENLLNYLKEDQPFNPYWDQYGVDEAQWNAEPNTEYIAFSIGKNALGEWGPLARVEFNTYDQTGVNELAAQKAHFTIDATQVAAMGLKEGSEICVYDLNGRLVASARANKAGEVSIATDALNRGVYIVTDGTTTRKFVK